MRLTIVGGGGFRVPLVHAALLADRGTGRVTELRLFDTSRTRLKAIAAVLAAQAVHQTDPPTVTLHDAIEPALAETDFVFSAMRVGGVAGRALDELLCTRHGVLGQETVGAGGVSYGLRTVPVALRLAQTIAECAPKAWTINFTNPAGLVTEAMATVLGRRVIGICDSPVGLARRVVGALGIEQNSAEVDYVGLNHLGWLRAVRIEGVDLLPTLFFDDVALASFEEGRLFGARWLRALGAVPNEYLHYYYFARETRLADRSAAQGRGTYLARQQARFFRDVAASPAKALQIWHAALRDRETTYGQTARDVSGAATRDEADLAAGGYDRVALALMRAIAQNECATLILNVPNAGTLPELDETAVVEVPCRVDSAGPKPLAVGPLPDYAAGLVTTVKYVERCTLEAALTGSKAAALRALGSHPLVDSVAVAADLLDDDIAGFPELAYLH